MDDDGTVGLELLEEVKPWLEELRQTGQTIVGFVDAVAESETLAAYQHVPLEKRRAELALFYLWWIDKYVQTKVAGTGREESCSAVLQAYVSDFVPEMDEIGEVRWEMFSYFESQSAAVNVYAAAPIQGMDPEVQDEEAVNRLVVYLAGVTSELDNVWQGVDPRRDRASKAVAVDAAHPLLVVATDDGMGLVQIDAPRIEELCRKNPLEGFMEAGVLHAALQSMCDALIQQGIPGPLSLVVCLADGTTLGSFDADTTSGYLQSTEVFRSFLAEVREILDSPTAIGTIEIPSNIPHRNFSPEALG